MSPPTAPPPPPRLLSAGNLAFGGVGLASSDGSMPRLRCRYIAISRGLMTALATSHARALLKQAAIRVGIRTCSSWLSTKYIRGTWIGVGG